MKNWKAFLTLCLCAALILAMTACAGETALRGEQEADPKLPVETSISPEETIDKQGETLVAYEPTTDDESQPEQETVTLPTEVEIITPGLISKTEFDAVRAQGISAEKMKFLISKYLPAPGSESNLSWVHIADGDSLAKFMQEVDSNVFRDACAPYDQEFFGEYDLIVIPRITNTGSMEHSVELLHEDGELRVSVSVTEPEFSTMVMTNWLLVVPVAKADVQGVAITVGMDIEADLPMPTVGIGKLG